MIAEKAQAVKDQGGVAKIGLPDIMGILTTLLGLIANCGKNPAQATRILNRMGPIQRLRVQQIIKDRFGKPNNKLANNIETVAQEVSVSETREMMDEIGAL